MSGLKDYLALLIVVAGLFIGYAELRLPALVKAELAAQGVASDGSVTQLKTALEEQKVVHREDRDRMDGKIERIVGILLEE